MKQLSVAATEAMRRLVPDRYRIERKTDVKGVTTLWCVLADKADLPILADFLAEQGARLSTITPYAADKTARGGTCEIAYHFDLDGDTLTITVSCPAEDEVDSITPVFANADWPEREMAELYGIKLKGHPHPERLFIDETLGEAVFDRFIPYSTMVNAATTKGLWEQVIAKGKAEGQP